jgi:hypothetical protein
MIASAGILKLRTPVYRKGYWCFESLKDWDSREVLFGAKSGFDYTDTAGVMVICLDI